MFLEGEKALKLQASGMGPCSVEMPLSTPWWVQNILNLSEPTGLRSVSSRWLCCYQSISDAILTAHRPGTLLDSVRQWQTVTAHKTPVSLSLPFRGNGQVWNSVNDTAMREEGRGGAGSLDKAWIPFTYLSIVNFNQIQKLFWHKMRDGGII